ncbi:MAG TPA: hypothetical protein DCZ91_19155 [Lachnospiraceae bacterium]|nr:hypothetical protein [Lachnospiraceae bacterium]
MKKGIKLAFLAVVLLGVCWFAGQKMKAARLARLDEPVNQEADVWSLLGHMDSDKVSLEGRKEDSDYPYGYNVGAIEDEQVGKAILLTPDTAIEWEGILSEDASLTIDFFLHPWVADGSDGALLSVAVISGGTVHDYVYEVSANLQNETISLEEFSGEVQIKLTVVNEEGRNKDCDWVILTQCFLSAGAFREE